MSGTHTTMSQVLPTGILLDEIYEIEDLLGSGGFGRTYRVFDRQLERRLAVKEFFPAETAMRTGLEVHPIAETKRIAFEKGLTSFSQEARHLASVTHPNIVKVFRSFDANGTSYILLEYIEGQDLEDWLNALGAAPTQAELDRLAKPLLSALELIHGAQILHRDIAPKNIRIRNRDQTPVLLDFGLAKSIAPEASSQTSAVIVAHGYAPTESYATGTKLQGPWTDIYGLAAVLYRALTGAQPLTAPERLFDDQLVPAVSLPNASNYRKSFLDGIDWGLSINPADRPQNIADWRATLIDGKARAKGGVKPSPSKDLATKDAATKDLAATAILPVADLGSVLPDGAKQERRIPYGLIVTVLFIAGAVAVGMVVKKPLNPEDSALVIPNVPRPDTDKGRAGIAPSREEEARMEELRLQTERERATAAREIERENAAQELRAKAEREAAEEAKQKQAALEEQRKAAVKQQKESVTPQKPSQDETVKEKPAAEEKPSKVEEKPSKSAAIPPPEEAAPKKPAVARPLPEKPARQQEEQKPKPRWNHRSASREAKEPEKPKRVRARPERSQRSAEPQTRRPPSHNGGGGGGASTVIHGL